MRALFERLRGVAHLPDSVLLRGERGSGRLTLARGIHELSRPGTPFVVVDAAAIPPAIRDSTLLGHESTTFTGAHRTVRGALENAEGGTLVIREVAAIPFDLQPKLLRALQDRQFRRIGTNIMRPVQAHIIATTNCALEELVKLRLFRGDLLEALMIGGDFTVPPLRERVADLPALLGPSLAAVGVQPLDANLIARLSALPWRGNVAELETFARGIAHRASPASAVTELELLEAIVAAPDDDATRLVYGDLLASRGDARGELIQVQCRLADPAFHADVGRLRAAEKKLLDAHHTAWAGPVAEVAGTPSTTAVVTFRRGFADRVVTTDDVLGRLDAVYRVAPVMSELAVVGRLRREHWVDPAIRRIHSLEVQLPSLDEPEVVALGSHPYFEGLRSLSVVTTEPGFATNDPVIGEAHITALATSPYLANLSTLRFTDHRFDARMAAVLTHEEATWSLAHLGLAHCGIDDAAVDALLAGPSATVLRTLDLRGNPIGGTGRALLAARSGLAVLLDPA